MAEDTDQAGAVSQDRTCLNGGVGGWLTKSKNTGAAVLLHNGVFCNGRITEWCLQISTNVQMCHIMIFFFLTVPWLKMKKILFLVVF